MAPASEDPDFLRGIRERSAAHDGVFWLNDRQLMLADADTARRVHADNFADLTLPDRFVDQVRRRRSTPVSWRHVRSLWLAQLRILSEPVHARALADRMDALLLGRADTSVDLVWLAHEVVYRSLVPIIVDGLGERDRAALARDAIAKLARLIGTGGGAGPTPRQRRMALAAQVRVGIAVRREIRGRATGRRPARTDLTQPIVDELLPALGPDRALDAVTAVLTAVAGPPGAAAACVMFELLNRPDWAGRVAEELSGIPAAELYGSMATRAPVTQRFLREVLRMWTPPLLMTRSVRTPIARPNATLAIGQQYLVSPFMVHHDPRHWQDPETFDPDRWLPGAVNGPASGQYSVPFGWAPTSCVGAGIGMLQLTMLCHLLSTRYRIKADDPAAARIALAAVPLPMDFRGTVVRR